MPPNITSVAGEHDPREVLFGVLAVARDLLGSLEEQTGANAPEILPTLTKASQRIGSRRETLPYQT